MPGVLRMLEKVHQREGRLKWAELFEPAIKLAEEGFAVSPRLHDLLANEKHLRAIPAARAYFYGADGEPAGSGNGTAQSRTGRHLPHYRQGRGGFVL